MAVTASYIQQDSYYPEDLMQRDADWIQPGVVSLSDLTATASGSALQVTISGSAENATGGNAWVPGAYRINNSAALTLTLAAANATYGRIDLIECGVNTGTNPYTPTIQVVTGTPSGTPAVPATDSGFIALYQVAVPANATIPGAVTDVRQLASPSQGIYTAVPTIVAPNGTKILVYAGGALTPYVAYAGAWVPIATQAWTSAQIAAAATPMATSAPPAIGTANEEGVSTQAARADHTHEGVTSIAGGSGISVSASTGAVTVTNTAVTPAATSTALGTVEVPQTVATPMSSQILATTTPAEVTITGTTAQTVLTATLTRNGNVRVSGSYRLTAAAQVTLTITYTDGGGTAQTVPWYTGPAAQAIGTYLVDVVPTFFATTAAAVSVQVTCTVANAALFSGVMEGL